MEVNEIPNKTSPIDWDMVMTKDGVKDRTHAELFARASAHFERSKNWKCMKPFRNDTGDWPAEYGRLHRS